MKFPLWCIVALTSLAWLRSVAAVPASIFDGTSLAGWESNATTWSVDAGVLNGAANPEASLTWSGVVHDFELTFEFRLAGSADARAELRFRAERQAGGGAAALGYQVDLPAGDARLRRASPDLNGAVMVLRGTRAAIAPDGRRWSDELAASDESRARIKPNEWNTCRIVAKGPHLELWINHDLVSALDDHQLDSARYSGRLELSAEGSRSDRVQFRQLFLTDLGRTELPPGPAFKLGGDDFPTILPLGANGAPINLNFETGTLVDWTAEGDAWEGMPLTRLETDPPPAQPTRHQGQSWIGFNRRIGDSRTGQLTSAPFRVSQRWASFLVGGGAEPSTRVEVVDFETGRVLHAASGTNSETMRRTVIDLQEALGRLVFIRLIDAARGWWGHVSFDDFVFHADKPVSAAVHAGDALRPHESPVLWHLRPNPAPPTAVANASAQRLVAGMLLPHGFQAELIAAEPDVHQPIAFTIDERGRLWVVEAHSYPSRQPQGQGKDRVLIFEDADGDGTFERRSVFVEGLNLVSGIEVGFGGVWIGAAPELLFIPDRNGDDRPDGPPQVLLDGWGYQDTHETLNSFTWGPDGWLYGNQGVFTKSLVGRPGVSEKERQALRAAVWRYHPTRHVFEVFSHGGSNQWGLDFNALGHLFMTHCRSFHGGGGTTYAIRNGHFWNQTNSDYPDFISNAAPAFAPALKNLLPASARYDSGEGGAGKPGTRAIYGGHSHVGTMIYLGDNWPEIYRDHLFTHNLHGHQLNQQVNVRRGSAYETFHAGHDLWYVPDPTYVAVALRTGPDGAVYSIDWADQQHCHSPHDERWDRTSGRIYRSSWGETYRPKRVNLAALSDVELVDLHTHQNEWFVRTARRILQDRATQRELAPEAIAQLRQQAGRTGPAVGALRAYWTLHVIGKADAALISAMLDHPDDAVRAWGVQLGTEDPQRMRVPVDQLLQLARADSSAMVRLAVASTLPLLAPEVRWAIGEALAARGEDAEDRFLPRMIWFGLAGVTLADIPRAAAIAGRTPLSTLADSIHWFISRSSQGRSLIVERLRTAPDLVAHRELRLLDFSVRGEATLPEPESWAQVAPRFIQSGDAPTKSVAEQLSAVFGDQAVLSRMRSQMVDTSRPPPERLRAFQILKRVGDRSAIPLYIPLLEEESFRPLVVPLLSGTDDPAAAARILRHFAALKEPDQLAALNTLTSRPSHALALLDAVDAGRFEKKSLTALHIRQMRNLADPAVNRRLDEVWGRVGDASEEAKAAIARIKSTYEAAPLWAYSAKAGADVYQRVCAACHAIAGFGGRLGPDLAGSWRNGVDYFLENIIDPNAVVGANFQLNVITKKDGTVISGMIEKQTDSSLIIRTTTEAVSVPLSDIKERQTLPQSLMPAGLLETLSDRETIELLKFLTTRS